MVNTTNKNKRGLVRLASLAVNDELHRQLKIRCSELGLKIKNIANEAIGDWLKKHEGGKGSKGGASFFGSLFELSRIRSNKKTKL